MDVELMRKSRENAVNSIQVEVDCANTSINEILNNKIESL